MSSRRDAYKSTGVSANAASERRFQQAHAVGQQRRDAAKRAKRMRFDPELAELAAITAGAVEPPSASPQQLQQAVEAIRAARGVGGAQYLCALRLFRQLLAATGRQPPVQAVMQCGAVPLLVDALQPKRADPEAAQTVFEAAWALTNIAAASSSDGDDDDITDIRGHQAAAAVAPAAPALIAHLCGGYGPAVAEQCAWAVGNIAADSCELRERVAANGALRPLWLLVEAGVRAAAGGGDATAAAAGATAAWALSHLVRGSADRAGQLLALPHCAQVLVSALSLSLGQWPSLVTEAAWLATFLTAGPDPHLQLLVAAGATPPLARMLDGAASQLHQQEPTPQSAAAAAAGTSALAKKASGPLALLIPVLRSLGNIAAGAGPQAAQQLLCSGSSAAAAVAGTAAAGAESRLGIVPALLACLLAPGTVLRSLHKEAAWALSNIAGLPGCAGVNAILAGGGVSPLVDALQNGTFDVRKEVAYCVANLCAGGGGGTGDPQLIEQVVLPNHQAVMGAYMALLRCPDAESNRLALQWTEMVLRCTPAGRGPPLVEEADGIDALEEVQFREVEAGGNPELQAMAAELVDTYFGEDYGL